MISTWTPLANWSISDYFLTNSHSKKLQIPMLQKMRPSSKQQHNKKQKLQIKRSNYNCSALCCNCRRLSVSSSNSDQDSEPNFTSISSLAHAMVQERLDQLIKEKQQQQQQEEGNSSRHGVIEKRRYLKREQQGTSSSSNNTKFVVMVAMEKCSYDPREDFRESMIEMILANRLRETKDLRRLLNYYLSMNSQDCHAVILQVFHEVCSDLFLSCKFQ